MITLENKITLQYSLASGKEIDAIVLDSFISKAFDKVLYNLLLSNWKTMASLALFSRGTDFKESL